RAVRPAGPSPPMPRIGIFVSLLAMTRWYRSLRRSAIEDCLSTASPWAIAQFVASKGLQTKEVQLESPLQKAPCGFTSIQQSCPKRVQGELAVDKAPKSITEKKPEPPGDSFDGTGAGKVAEPPVSATAVSESHPPAIWFFFWGEFAERSSYYGMRAILFLYLT